MEGSGGTSPGAGRGDQEADVAGLAASLSVGARSTQPDHGGLTVWMYWEDPPGRSLPGYLSLCRDTVRRHLGPSMTLQVLDRQGVGDWLPDLDESVWARLTIPAQRADYARTRLIHRHGGLWIDADCIAMSSLDELWGYLGDHELMAWGADVQGRFFNNLFGAPAGSPLVARWIEAQDRALAGSEDWNSLDWAALGSGAFYPLLAGATYANVPAAKVAPVLWYAWRRLLSPYQSPVPILGSLPVTVMLWNKGMGPLLADKTAGQVLGSKMLLARLLRIALGNSTLEDELDLSTRLSPLSDLRYGARGRSIERRLRHLF